MPTSRPNDAARRASSIRSMRRCRPIRSRTYAWLRDEPVYVASWRRGADLYVLSRHDDVVAALKDPATFSSQVAPAPILMFKDPPEHTRLRRTLQRAFTPRAIEALAPRIEEIARPLCEAYLDAGGGDFIDAFAHPLPALVIGEMLGVPEGRRHELRRWSDDTIRSLGGGIGLGDDERAAAQQGMMQLLAPPAVGARGAPPVGR